MDPFCGTGTTALCVAMRGGRALSTDINPFLAWLSAAKTAHYTDQACAEIERMSQLIARSVARQGAPMAAMPPIHNVERWWRPAVIDYLRRVKWQIESTVADMKAKDLLLVAFCRALIETANVTRRHQSLSFREGTQLGFAFERDVFAAAVRRIAASARVNPRGVANIRVGDARKLVGVEDSEVDLVVTSPPYPNRVTAIRELRPYMYWLEFLKDPADAGELDWRAIGGTWGGATHRLLGWRPDKDVFIPRMVGAVSKRIEAEGKESAVVMASYVLRYFQDIWVHLTEIKRVLKRGGRLYYVVGNASFYGNVVEAEKAFVDILSDLGFRRPVSHVLRKRSSKSELFEFIVTATRP